MPVCLLCHQSDALLGSPYCDACESFLIWRALSQFTEIRETSHTVIHPPRQCAATSCLSRARLECLMCSLALCGTHSRRFLWKTDPLNFIFCNDCRDAIIDDMGLCLPPTVYAEFE